MTTEGQGRRSPPWRQGRIRARERGVAAIAMALLSMGLAGAAIVSFLLTRSEEAQTQVENQADVLAWADQAVRDYAMVNGRLPCPATSRNGFESCNGAIKGWLPVRTLLGSSATARPEGVTHLPIRYITNGAGMSTASSAFMPRLESGAPMEDYPTNIVSGTDLCEKVLAVGGRQSFQVSSMVEGVEVQRPLPRSWLVQADVPLASATWIHSNELVYGVAVAAQGASDSASGLNASSGNRFELPTRQKSHQYQDLVRVVRPFEFYNHFGCGTTAASLDTMAVAHMWSGVNEGTREGVIGFADKIVDIVRYGLIADGIFLVTQTADLANGVYNNGGNVIKMAQAASVPWLWHWVPVHAQGIVTAVIGMTLTVVDLAISSLNIVMDTMYMAAYQAAADELGAFQVWTGGLPMLEAAHRLSHSVIVPEDAPPPDPLPTPEPPPDVIVPVPRAPT